MQLSFILIGALLPLGLLASPTTPSDAEVEARRAINRPQCCHIVGSSATIKCREGPGTKWDVRTTLRRATAYDFWCVYSKECITGSTNWNTMSALAVKFLLMGSSGWHYIPVLKCFVKEVRLPNFKALTSSSSSSRIVQRW